MTNDVLLIQLSHESVLLFRESLGSRVHAIGRPPPNLKKSRDVRGIVDSNTGSIAYGSRTVHY